MKKFAWLAAGTLVFLALPHIIAPSMPRSAASVDDKWGDPTFPDVPYKVLDDGYAMKLDIWVPEEGTGPWPAVVVVHGAWGHGLKDSYDGPSSVLKDAGFVAFNIDYRSYCDPEDPPPDHDPGLCGYHAIAPAWDVKDAVEWVRANGAQYGASTDLVGALGGSGGANLAMMAATLGGGLGKPDAVVSWSGQTELWKWKQSSDPPRLKDAHERYVGCPWKGEASCPDRWLLASPITHVNSEDSPMYLSSGSEELIPLVQATDMDAALREVGVETFLRVIPGSLHSRQYLDYVVDQETGLTVLQECLKFMHDHIG